MTHRRVIIADDEPLARYRIRMMVAPLDGYQLVAECGDGPSTVEAIIEHRPHVVFLDIKMPGLDGFDVLTAVEGQEHAPAIIFATAFDQHAVRAFDINAVDYLLKPFNKERLRQALDRAEARLAANTAYTGKLRTFLGAIRPAQAYPDRFLVRGANHLYFVRTADVEWVDAAANYVRLHSAGRAHFVRDTITAFCEKLSPEQFIRVHRSAVVNIDSIQKIEPHTHGEYTITLKDGTRLKSSRAYTAPLRDLFRGAPADR